MTVVMVTMSLWQSKLAEKYLISQGINIPSLVLFKFKMTELQAYLAVAMVIHISFHSGSFPNLAGKFHYGKVILYRYRCCGNSITLATDSDQFYSLVLSTNEIRIGVWTSVGQKIVTQTQLNIEIWLPWQQ